MSQGGIDNPGAYNPFQPQSPQTAQPASPQPQGGGLLGILSSLFGGGASASPAAPSAAPAAPMGPSVAGPTGAVAGPAALPPDPLAGNGLRPNPFTPGSLMWATVGGGSSAPTPQEYAAQLQHQQQQRMGALKSQVFQALAADVKSGTPPTQAFLHLMNTPLGVKFVSESPDPGADIKSFMQMAVPDPEDAALAAMGNPGAAPPVATAAPTGAVAMPAPPAVQGAPIAPISPPGTPDAASVDQTAVPPVATPGAGPTPGAISAPDMNNPPVASDKNSSAYWTDQAQKYANIARVSKDPSGGKAMALSKQALEIAKQLQTVETGKTSPDIVNYNFEQRQNKLMGQPSKPFSEWLLDNKRASSPGGDMEVQGLKARIDMNSKVYEKTIQPAEANARTMLQTLDELQPYLGADGGVKGATEAQLAKWGDLLNFKVTNGMANAQVLQALTAKMQAAFRPVGTGSTSDYEQTLFASAVPGIMQSPEARQKIADINRRFAERAVEVGKIYQRYVGDPDKLADEMDKLDKRHIFNPQETSEMEKLAQAGGGAPAGKPDSTDVPGSGPDPHAGMTRATNKAGKAVYWDPNNPDAGWQP